MRIRAVLAGTLATTAACLAVWAAAGDTPKASPLPRLKVDRSSAPRLDAGPKKDPAKRDGKARADNGACYVCHGNYQDEPLAQAHAAENIGCVKCHGESVAHRNDEDHRTPPDVMYAEGDIDRACAKCHDRHDVAAKKVVACWQKKCPAKTDPEALVCTDCHNEHRLKFRSFWWDKKTREFVTPKDDQRTKPAADLTRPPAKVEPTPEPKRESKPQPAKPQPRRKDELGASR
jgi:hypothetical protein